MAPGLVASAAKRQKAIDRLAREVNDMKVLPPVTKRRIGFIIDDE